MLLKIRDAINEYSQLNESFNFNDSRIRYKEGKSYDLFLSYNHKDIILAKSIYHILTRKHNLSVYVDFIDPSFNRNIVDERTAQILCKRLASCKALAYIHTSNSQNSKWCPWEIGLASGLKNFKCVIIPGVVEDDIEYERQEYLLLYPFTSYHWSRYQGDGPYFWVRNDFSSEPIFLNNWINS